MCKDRGKARERIKRGERIEGRKYGRKSVRWTLRIKAVYMKGESGKKKAKMRRKNNEVK